MLELLVGALVEVTQKPREEVDIRDRAKVVSRSAGFTRTEWKCLDELIWRESRWDPKAENGSHYGLGQMKHGKPYLKGKPVVQIKKTIKYIKHRYGTPCKALSHHDVKNWY
jgi:hypothetical protein